LAQLNRQLIVDEGSDNPMDEQQLCTRMTGFLTSGYRAWLFVQGDTVCGYALVHMQSDPPYVRQFLILATYRRHGFGRQAFAALHHLLGGGTLELDVLVWNQAGAAFWQALGFQPRFTRMRLTP
jgi:predicted acetyltransferase